MLDGLKRFAIRFLAHAVVREGEGVRASGVVGLSELTTAGIFLAVPTTSVFVAVVPLLIGEDRYRGLIRNGIALGALAIIVCAVWMTVIARYSKRHRTEIAGEIRRIAAVSRSARSREQWTSMLIAAGIAFVLSIAIVWVGARARRSGAL